MALSDERGGLQVAGKIKVLIGLALLVVTAGLLLFSDGESESINANSPRESSYDASRPELPGVYTCDGFTASGGPLAVAGRPRQVHEANRQPPMDGRDEHHEAAHPRLRDNAHPNITEECHRSRPPAGEGVGSRTHRGLRRG
ncbi:MAG: hypothetical protein U5N86_03070 [Planctomycetota bacterium]|nr:hypothetical protein [Planctomycetota bacterium]